MASNRRPAGQPRSSSNVASLVAPEHEMVWPEMITWTMSTYILMNGGFANGKSAAIHPTLMRPHCHRCQYPTICQLFLSAETQDRISRPSTAVSTSSSESTVRLTATDATPSASSLMLRRRTPEDDHAKDCICNPFETVVAARRSKERHARDLTCVEE